MSKEICFYENTSMGYLYAKLKNEQLNQYSIKEILQLQEVTFENNLLYVIIFNKDKGSRRWGLGTAIYQKNDSSGIYKNAE